MNNMIKYYILIASLIIGCFEANAQVQVEPYVGLTMPIRNIGASEVNEVAGLNAGIEIRKNISSSPLTVGADLFMASSVRQMERQEGGHSSNSQRMVGVAAVCDYNLLLGKSATLFFGTGVGLSQRHTVSSGIEKGIGICAEYGPVVAPRAGVQLCKHMRITVEARFTQRDYNLLAFRLGYTFGKL